jgi:predicted nucleic acid-binding protein
MKLFVDANVLVAVLNKEYPTFTYAARILSLADVASYEIWTSPVCLAIAYYFSEKKSGSKHAKAKLKGLCEKIHVTSTGYQVVLNALENKRVLDFEDGIEYYSAIDARCTFIITEDETDFYFSEIPVSSCEDFLMKHF